MTCDIYKYRGFDLSTLENERKNGEDLSLVA
jgi:hypothetical protein